MRLVQYRCDWCRVILSDRGPGKDHLSVAITAKSGRASLESPLPGWRIVQEIEPRTYHWCAPKCMNSWFTALFGEMATEYTELKV